VVVARESYDGQAICSHFRAEKVEDPEQGSVVRRGDRELLRRRTRGVVMAIPKTGEIVLVWRGALVASHYPVPKEEQDDPTRWVGSEGPGGAALPPEARRAAVPLPRAHDYPVLAVLGAARRLEDEGMTLVCAKCHQEAALVREGRLFLFWLCPCGRQIFSCRPERPTE
jgi:hypothetical protein